MDVDESTVTLVSQKSRLAASSSGKPGSQMHRDWLLQRSVADYRHEQGCTPSYTD